MNERDEEQSVDEETVALNRADLDHAAATSDDAGADVDTEDVDADIDADPDEAEPANAAPDEDSLAEQAEAAGIDPEDEVAAEPQITEADSDSTVEAADSPASKPARPTRRGFTSLFRPRLTSAGAFIAVLVGLLGFALIAQVQSNSSSTTLNNDRPEDLVRILSDLDARKDRLNTEISNLQDTQRQLESGAEGRAAAIADSARRADELGILAGSLAAQGPGLAIHLADGTEKIGAADVLDIVEELRGAGAEAMQIAGTNGTTVRIVASTFFVDSDAGVVVDGHPLPGPLTLTAIGDPQTMQTALSIPGGALDTTKSHGGNVQLDSPGTVQVTAIHPTTVLKYAKPSS